MVLAKSLASQMVGSVWFGALFHGLLFFHYSGKVNASREYASENSERLQLRFFRALHQATLTAFIRVGAFFKK